MTEGESREAAETRRIEDEYRYRDVARATSALYSFGDPAHVLYLQELEWELLRVLRDLDVDLSTSRVLDVGCGFGYLTHRLSEYGAHTTVGIDLMQHRIDEARTRYPSITFERADATKLPFESASFDLITQFTCLSSVLDVQVRQLIASELWRVLAGTGVIVSYDMGPESVVLRLVGAWHRIASWRAQEPDAPVTTATRPVSAAELRQLFHRKPDLVRRVVLTQRVRRRARHSPLVRQLVGRVPGLRSHVLAAIRKPPLGPGKT
jgi:ubiquinone/menaquinone biosynthesis C-methylase UbiE